MYGDMQITIMTRQVERERLESHDARLRRAGWYSFRAQARHTARPRTQGSADRWARLALALTSRPLRPSQHIAGLWRRQLRNGKQDNPPARACLPM